MCEFFERHACCDALCADFGMLCNTIGHSLSVASSQVIYKKEYHGAYTDSEKSKISSAAVLGAIIGQIAFGFLADFLGRKKGLITTTVRQFFVATFLSSSVANYEIAITWQIVCHDTCLSLLFISNVFGFALYLWVAPLLLRRG